MAVDTASLITLVELKSQMGITSTTDDTVLERCIDRASKAVESYCARAFTSNRYYETHDTTSQWAVVLKQNPVTAVRLVATDWQNALTIDSTDKTDTMTTVAVNESGLMLFRKDSAGNETANEPSFAAHNTTAELATHINGLTGFSATSLINLPSVYLRKMSGMSLRTSTAYLGAWMGGFNDYQVDLATGIVYGKQTYGYRSMFIDYTAGYARIPYDIQEATTMIASRIYNGRKRDTGVGSESLGGYSYSIRSSGEFDAEARDLLQTYKRAR